MGQPKQVWVTDITYIRTHEDWLSLLTVVTDVYWRTVTGWSMNSAMATELLLDAIDSSLAQTDQNSRDDSLGLK